ncbi:MAG: flavin-dependent dehydrogenase, partial [Waterburya sp.]
WLTFTRLALVAARKNPALLIWIWQMAGNRDLLRWLGSYLAFNLDALRNLLLSGWFSGWLKQSQPWLEKQYPGLWLKLLSLNYQTR